MKCPSILPSRFCSLPSDAHEPDDSEGVVVQEYRGSEKGIGTPGEEVRGATSCRGEELGRSWEFGKREACGRCYGLKDTCSCSRKRSGVPTGKLSGGTNEWYPAVKLVYVRACCQCQEPFSLYDDYQDCTFISEVICSSTSLRM
jgi:hypothetical protein